MEICRNFYIILNNTPRRMPRPTSPDGSVVHFDGYVAL